MTWGESNLTTVGVHWLRATGEVACDEPAPERATAAMGGVTCSVCRTIIDLELDLICERVVPPYRVPMPAPASEWDLSDLS